jgi:hypothetical protein
MELSGFGRSRFCLQHDSCFRYFLDYLLHDLYGRTNATIYVPHARLGPIARAGKSRHGIGCCGSVAVRIRLQAGTHLIRAESAAAPERECEHDEAATGERPHRTSVNDCPSVLRVSGDADSLTKVSETAALSWWSLRKLKLCQMRFSPWGVSPSEVAICVPGESRVARGYFDKYLIDNASCAIVVSERANGLIVIRAVVQVGR